MESRAAALPAARRAPSARRRVLAVALLHLAWLLGNELFANVRGLLVSLGHTKVLSSIAGELGEATLPLLGDLAAMLALSVLLAALPCVALAAVQVAAWRALPGPVTARRWARWLFAAGSTLAAANVWYGLHGLLFPGSRLEGSPAAVLCGAFDGLDKSQIVPRIVAGAVCALLLLALAAFALAASRPLRRAAAVAALGLAAVTAGYEAATAPRLAPFTAPGSLVVLGLDSFQDNRLGPLTPNVSGFLAGAHRFDNAWTPLARTYPSWVSILTGRYPVHHGIRFNLLPDRYLRPDNPWLPDLLERAGYASLHATDETRFSIIRPVHGFDRLLHPAMGLPDVLAGAFFDFSATNLARQTALGDDLFPLLSANRAVTGYSPRLFVRRFLQRLDMLPRDRPAFVTAHLCGNHWPFDAPFPWWRRGDDPVDGCVAMVDAQVGALLAALSDCGLLGTATTVLLSDHGDGWSGDPDDETNTHGDHLDAPLANKVVLGVRGPGIVPGRTGALVRTFDLHPTLLELAGAPPAPAPTDGRSLLPFLRGAGAAGPAREVFAETGFDKKTFLVARLVQESSRWYEVAPDTLLVTLRDDGYDELVEGKSYMLLDGDLRLLLTPERRRVLVNRIDTATGDEQEVTDELDPAVRLSLLLRVVEHYGLPRAEILEMAVLRGFLPAAAVARAASVHRPGAAPVSSAPP